MTKKLVQQKNRTGSEYLQQQCGCRTEPTESTQLARITQHLTWYWYPLVKRVTQEGNTYKIVPAAAESWDISEDGLTYTFHMNKDAKWSDETKVTANDFEFTFQKMATPSVAATNAWLFDGIIENFSEALYDQGKKPEEIGVHAIDEDTLEIKIIPPGILLPGTGFLISLSGKQSNV